MRIPTLLHLKEPANPAPKVNTKPAAKKEERSSGDPESSEPTLTNLIGIRRRPPFPLLK